MTNDPNDIDGLKLSTDPASRGRYLGDPAVVSELVRGFASHILTLRAEWHLAPDDEKIDPTEEIEQLGAALGDVFLGRNASYVAQPFNAPNRLGVLMRGLVPTAGEPGAAFFAWYALQVVKASIEMEKGGDEEAVFQQLEAITSDVVERLLGRNTP